MLTNGWLYIHEPPVYLVVEKPLVLWRHEMEEGSSQASLLLFERDIMTETYLQKLHRERKARLSRIALASIVQSSPPSEQPPSSLPSQLDTKLEVSPEDQILYRKEVIFKDIFRAVCQHYGISMLDVLSARRMGKIVLARHVIVHIAVQHTKCSLRIIASRLARDKSTIEHAVKRMSVLSQTDAIGADIAAIKKRLGL